MLRARNVTVGAVGVVAGLVACVGGPGSLPDPGAEQQNQGGNSTTISTSESPTTGPGRQTTGNPSGTATTTSAPPPPGPTSTGTTTPPVPQNIRGTEFDQSCSQPSDCVAVYEGVACNQCFCSNTAINVKDKAKYDAAFAERRKGCTTTDVQCAACATVTAICSSNRCSTVTGIPPRDAGSDG